MSQKTTDFKEGKAQVKVVYYTSKTLADGSHPFVVRINKHKTRKHIATGLSLHPKYWNPDKGEIRRSYPEPFRSEILKKLAEWEAKYEKAAETLTDADEQHDAATVARKAVEGRKQTRRVQVLAYTDEQIAGLKQARRHGSSETYTDVRSQLAAFFRDELDNAPDLSFDRITVAFCNQFENYLRGRGNTENTVASRFRVFRAILNKAIADGSMKPDRYPFARNVAERHKFSIGKFDTRTSKRAISRADVRKVEEWQVPAPATGKYASLNREHERLQLAKDIFLFSFYVAGINFVDLAQLRWKDIQTDNAGSYRVTYTRQKTGGRFSLKLLAPAAAIVERYRAETFTSPDSYLFPILDKVIHNTPDKVKNRLHKVLGQVNPDLKTIGQAIGLTIPLTTYVARHSFATNLKRAGHANAVIGQALGHADESTTNIYLDSFGSDAVDAAFDSLL